MNPYRAEPGVIWYSDQRRMSESQNTPGFSVIPVVTL